MLLLVPSWRLLARFWLMCENVLQDIPSGQHDDHQAHQRLDSSLRHKFLAAGVQVGKIEKKMDTKSLSSIG